MDVQGLKRPGEAILLGAFLFPFDHVDKGEQSRLTERSPLTFCHG